MSWTITGWIDLTNYPVTYSAFVLGKDEDVDAKYNFAVAFWPLQHGHVNSIASSYETCTDEYDHPLYHDNIGLGEWVFFASVRDEDTGKHALYINGTEVASDIWTETPCANHEDLFIGYDLGANRSCFDGLIDDIRIYNRALSEAEIQELFSLPGPQPPPVEVDLDLRKFKIRKNKLTGRTVLTLRALPDLPELDVGDGAEVDARITIELFDVLEDGHNLVIKDERTLRVRETEDVLVIRK